MNGLIALRHEQDAIKSAFVCVFLRDGSPRTSEANMTMVELAILKMAVDEFANTAVHAARHQAPTPGTPDDAA